MTSQENVSENVGLPTGWATALLSEIIEVNYGKGLTKTQRDGGEIPVYGSSGITGYHSEALVNGPALVIGRKGAAGSVHLTKTDAWVIDTAYFASPPKNLSTEYLYYLLSFVGLGALDKSTTIPSLSRDDLYAQVVPLAPLNEQRRIVAEIETQFTRLDAGIAALKRVQANLKRYKASVLKAACEGRLVPQDPTDESADQLLERVLVERRAKWEADYLTKQKTPPRDDKWKAEYPEPQPPDTSDLPELPSGWVWTTFEAVSDVQGGIQKQPKRTPKENFYPYLRVANVLRGKLDLSEISEFELFGDELEKLRLEVGDLLIVEGNGSQDQIGRCAIWSGEIRDCVHQNHIIRARFHQVLPKYASYFLNSPIGIETMRRVASSTSGLYTLSVSKVDAITFPLAPLNEQRRIIEDVERRLSVIDDVEDTVSNLIRKSQSERQAILREAFAGRLVPQDPADEPVSALLDCIRAERAQRKTKSS